MKLHAIPGRMAILLLAAALNAGAAPAPSVAPPLGPVQNPLWLRHSSISPDGSQIAFAYQGNLYLVPSAGGAARLLVVNGAHSTQPVWSPDGQAIAYASDPNGNFDVYVVGPAKHPEPAWMLGLVGETRW